MREVGEGRVQPSERIPPVLKRGKERPEGKRDGSLAPGVGFFVLGVVIVVPEGVFSIPGGMVVVFEGMLRVLIETDQGPSASE
jgi:hypothetical protein